MRAYIFSRRNAKEILRDPLNMLFGLAFPLLLLLLFAVINSSIPAEADNTMFSPERLTPGLAMFGTSFMALFSWMLLAKDRTSSFLMRLFTSPMRAVDFIIGYTLPLILFSLLQSSITFMAAAFFGLPFTANTLLAIVLLVPISLMFVGIGLLCGSVMNDKAVGGICGALVINLVGWLSDVWIPIEQIGGAYLAISRALPFYHAAETARMAIAGRYDEILPHLAIVLAYTLVLYISAVLLFRHKMSSDKA